MRAGAAVLLSVLPAAGPELVAPTRDAQTGYDMTIYLDARAQEADLSMVASRTRWSMPCSPSILVPGLGPQRSPVP